MLEMARFGGGGLPGAAVYCVLAGSYHFLFHPDLVKGSVAKYRWQMKDWAPFLGKVSRILIRYK